MVYCMSLGAEKSQPPEVGIEPGPQDLKANTLPQGSRSVLYTYPYYMYLILFLVWFLLLFMHTARGL